MLDGKQFWLEVFVNEFFKSDHAWEVISETRASCFIGVSKHLETINAVGLRPRASICFSVFEYPDETLALVLEVVRLYLELSLGCDRAWTDDTNNSKARL